MGMLRAVIKSVWFGIPAVFASLLSFFLGLGTGVLRHRDGVVRTKCVGTPLAYCVQY